MALKQPLIFTFFIYTHGSVRNLVLNTSTNKIFERCRLFSETAHDLSSTCSNPYVDHMISISRKNIFGPMYNLFTKDASLKPMASITFDKILGAERSEIDGWFSDEYGIYLLSVHQKMENGNNVFVEYPVWNLLKIDKLKQFAQNISGREIGTPGSEPIVMPTDEFTFLNWSGIQLDDSSQYIIRIKMSKFVELIKSIVGENVYFNLLDFSCSNNRAETPVYKWHTQIADVENMEGVEIWGGGMNMGVRRQKKKIVKRTRHKVRRHKASRHNRKSKRR